MMPGKRVVIHMFAATIIVLAGTFLPIAGGSLTSFAFGAPSSGPQALSLTTYTMEASTTSTSSAPERSARVHR
jgi:hypothetical protein